jgi:ankyrin repeat protein
MENMEKSNEESYCRYVNIQDRLGRTSLHFACMLGIGGEIL